MRDGWNGFACRSLEAPAAGEAIPTGPISLLINVKTEYPSEMQVLHGVLIRSDI